jgi:hypothetical protein
MIRFVLGLSYVLTASSCETYNNTDTVEKYYKKAAATSAGDCCSQCTADKACAFACFYETTCYLKNAATTTPKQMSGVTLIIVRQQPPGPPAPGPSPGPPPQPVPPLPRPKYKVELTEHSPEPAISSANAKGKGASPCNLTFNPAYVEVAGQVYMCRIEQAHLVPM